MEAAAPGAHPAGEASVAPDAHPAAETAAARSTEAVLDATPGSGPLPELASVYWRRRVDPGSLHRDARLWRLSTSAQVIPFLAFAAFLAVAAPITAPLGLVLVAHAWIVPALYAARGANVVRPKRASESGPAEGAQRRALGMLGDLLDREAFALYEQTGLVLEPGALGTWLVAEAGALLVAPGGRRVHCYCVAVPDLELPPADRVAHLLLALRCDEPGFATVANRAFVGAPWRLRPRLTARARPALAAAIAGARRDPVPAGAAAGQDRQPLTAETVSR